MSDLNTMNDSSEMHWAYDRFIEAVNSVLAKYEREYFDYLDKFISRMQTHTLTFISCLSKDGDVLSQWRAYADDGRGVAIGFDSHQLQKLSVRCAVVIYNREEQVEYFRQLLSMLYPLWKLMPQRKDAKRSLTRLLFWHAFDMCLIKNPAFAEEQEVRIARAITVTQNDSGWHISDDGGTGADKLSRAKQNIKFRTREAGIVAHIDLPIGGTTGTLIRKLVLGPKTYGKGVEFSMALNQCGFHGVEITRSRATYR